MPQSQVSIFRGSPEEWNRWLDQLGGASAYQYDPFIGARDRRLQILSGTAPVAGMVVVSAPVLGLPNKLLAVHRGPAGEFEAALGALEDWAHTEGAWCIDIMPDAPFDDPLSEMMQAREWRPMTAARYTLRLGLGPDEGQLLAGIESRGRYTLKREEGAGVVVRPARDGEDVARFCRLHAEMTTRKGISESPAEHLLRVGSYLLTRPTRGVVLIAEHDGEMLGASFLWRSAARVEYLYGASRRHVLATGGNVAGGYSLQWAGLRWAKAVGASEYDFGGYTPDATGGPALMKRAFCRNVVALSPRWRKILRPALFNAAQRLRDWIKGGQP